MTAADRITNFVLEHAERVPPAERAQLYLDLAALNVRDEDAKRLGQLAALAREHQAIEAQQLHLVFELKLRDGAGRDGHDGKLS